MARPRTGVVDQTLLQAALEGLTLQRERLDEQIRQVRSMLGKRGPGRTSAAAPAGSEDAPAPRKRRKRRKMSAEARKRIAEAQKKRWATFRKSKG